jgi:protein-S-isoprenylcysteine O-methyltransferase Ste14
VSILGDGVILLSFLFIFWVTRVNSFAASNIRVEKDQKVIDTGPYFVRRVSSNRRSFQIIRVQ